MRSRESARTVTSVPALKLLARWARGLDPRLLDGCLALALAGWVLAELPRLSEHTRPAVLVVMTLSIAFRRRWPLAVLAVVLACVLLNSGGDVGLAGLAAIVIAAYSAALHSVRRWPVAILLLATAAAAAVIGGGLPVPDWSVPFLVLGSVWLAGTALRRRELRAEAWEDRATQLEREQADALRAERARIARELHDVVTHGVSVMVLQTGAARQVLDKDTERAETLLRSVEAGGREALDELRHLLGLLSDEPADAPLAPRPGAAQLETLVARIREAGVDVELVVHGRERPLPPGIDLAAYRIVQEALTNTLRHGRNGPTRVIVTYTDAALELEVIDQSAVSSGESGAGERGGRGLVGMRERVAIYGGTLQARPEPENGYAVRARLPLTPLGS